MSNQQSNESQIYENSFGPVTLPLEELYKSSDSDVVSRQITRIVTERTLTAAAGHSPRDPYRQALTMRPSLKVRPLVS